MASFDAALRALVDTKVGTLILDLRTPAAHGEFAVAAQMLSRFLPPDQPLFSLQKPDDPRPQHFRSKDPPVWTGKLVLLIDEEANNVAETVAAVLEAKLHPPIFGSPTRGRTIGVPDRTDLPMRMRSGSPRRKCACPTARPSFARGSSPPSPLPSTRTPNIAASPPSRPKASGNPSIAPSARATTNRRSSPAPPQNSHSNSAESSGKPTEFDKPPLHDRVLQQAVDVLETQAFLAK